MDAAAFRAQSHAWWVRTMPATGVTMVRERHYDASRGETYSSWRDSSLSPVLRDPKLKAIATEDKARKALRALESAGADPSAFARALAQHGRELFLALAEMVDLPGGDLGISPDAVREWRALVGRTRLAILKARTIERRRRIYLELRIMKQVAIGSDEATTDCVESIAQRVLDLTVMDHHSNAMATLLAKHEAELKECIRAALPRKPTALGEWSRKSSNAQVDTYECAFAALCQALRLPVAAESSRASDRSRVARL